MNKKISNKFPYNLSFPAIALAPLAGYTNFAFRKICKEWGADLVFTELISSYGICYANEKTKKYFYFTEQEKPIIIQIFGSDPYIMAKAAEKINLINAEGIDINMGCSVPKVIKQKAGAALLQDFSLALKIVKEVVKISTIPVSIKIRKGWKNNENEVLNFLQEAENAGIKLVSVHPRYAVQKFSGSADWDFIKKVKEKLNIKVFASGDIKSGEDAKKVLTQTNCDGILIGRAALGNPWIFKQIKNYLKKENYNLNISLEEKIKTVIKHINYNLQQDEEKKVIREMKKHLHSYFKGERNCSWLKQEINKINNFIELKEVLNLYQNNYYNL